MRIGGEQRGAGVEQARPRHHGIGLRLAGRERGAERHIGRSPARGGYGPCAPGRRPCRARRTDGRCGRRAARRSCRSRARAGRRRRPRPVVIAGPGALARAVRGLRFACLRHDSCAACELGLRMQIEAALSRPSLALTKHDPHALFARLFPHLQAREDHCHASLPLPYLRRAPRQRHRRDRPPVGLGAPRPRSWRRAVHRPARPLRPDAGGGRPGQPGFQGRREAARRMGGAGRRQGAPRPGRHREPGSADRRWSRSSSTEIEVLGPAGELPMPVFGDQEYPEDIRLRYRFLDLRRERLHNNIIKRGADHRLRSAAA